MAAVKKIKKLSKQTVQKRLKQLFSKKESYIPYNLTLIKTLIRVKGNPLRDIEVCIQEMLYRGDVVMFCIDDNEYLTQNIDHLDGMINRNSSLPIRSEFREIVEIDQVHEKVLLYRVGIVTLAVTQLLIVRQFLLFYFVG